MNKPNVMLAKIEAAAEAKYRAAFLAKMDALQQMCIDSAGKDKSGRERRLQGNWMLPAGSAVWAKKAGKEATTCP